jgi:pentatricopeptide repeat protein
MHAAQAERALVVYEAMKAAAVPAGLLTFNLLLRCTAQARRRDDALRIKQDMDRLGVRPDAVTYTTLIEAVVKAGSARGRQPPAKRLNSAFELFQEMKGAGIEPDASTYNALIEACSLAQQVQPRRAELVRAVRGDGSLGASHR